MLTQVRHNAETWRSCPLRRARRDMASDLPFTPQHSSTCLLTTTGRCGRWWRRSGWRHWRWCGRRGEIRSDTTASDGASGCPVGVERHRLSRLAVHAINPAAWLFAGSSPSRRVAGRRSRAGIISSRPAAWLRERPPAGGYAFAYPLLDGRLRPSLSGGPTFAVPCPIIILTIGLFLTVPAVPRRLEAVPVMWSAIGGSAAILLDVPTDYALLGAGLMLAAVSLRPYLRHATRSSPE